MHYVNVTHMSVSGVVTLANSENRKAVGSEHRGTEVPVVRNSWLTGRRRVGFCGAVVAAASSGRVVRDQ